MIHLKKDKMIRITAGFLCLMMLLCLFGCDGTQIAAETGTTEPVTTMEPPQPAILAPEDMTELPQVVSVGTLEQNPGAPMLCYEIGYESDGQLLYAEVYMPHDYQIRDYPTLVFFPISQDLPLLYAQTFSSADMIFVVAFRRGIRNNGGTSEFHQDIADMETLLNICLETDFLNRGGVALAASGINSIYQTRLIQTFSDDLLGCVYLDGWLDLDALYACEDELYRNGLINKLTVGYEDNPALYQHSSVMDCVDEIDIPMRLFLYEETADILCRQADALCDQMQSDGKSCSVETLSPQHYEFNSVALTHTSEWLTELSQTQITLIEPESRAEDAYLYFVYNGTQMTDADMDALEKIEAWYTGADVVRIDISSAQYPSECAEKAEALYTALQEDYRSRDGTLYGIQIFGDSDMVPAFWVNYCISLFGKTSRREAFATDYFYSNFNNTTSELKSFSVYQYYRDGEQTDIYPQWQVVRLPLSSGSFTTYYENYRDYLELSKQQSVKTVAAVAPIFTNSSHRPYSIDDNAYFLKRARDEWNLIDDLALYGNLDGAFPVRYEVSGNVLPEIWTQESDDNLCEYYFCGHGYSNHILQTITAEDRTQTTNPILTTETINTYLNQKPYFLNMISCMTAMNLKNNLVSEAMMGRCIGAFAATSEISNQNVDCGAPLSRMQSGGTYFSHYYYYLYARNAGYLRSEAFLYGQQAVVRALSENIDVLESWQYQPSCNNLLCWQNLGLIDPVG